MSISALSSAAHIIKDIQSIAQNTNVEVEEEQYFKILDKAEAKIRAKFLNNNNISMKQILRIKEYIISNQRFADAD
jgi:hypothetical protein